MEDQNKSPDGKWLCRYVLVAMLTKMSLKKAVKMLFDMFFGISQIDTMLETVRALKDMKRRLLSCYLKYFKMTHS